MGATAKRIRVILLGIAYPLLLLASLVASHRYREFLPDGFFFFWIVPLNVVLACLCVVASPRRFSLPAMAMGLLAMAIAVPVISPLVGGGPDMFVVATMICFAVSCGFGMMLGRAIRAVRHWLKRAKRRHQWFGEPCGGSGRTTDRARSAVD